MTRRKAREMALQILFQKEFAPTANTQELFDLFQNHLSLGDDMVDYANTLVHQVSSKQAQIDELIGKYSINWNIKRFALVDLNILRIAVCELLFLPQDPPPPRSVINEAIEIAKRYSSQEAPGFINGLLDQILNKELKLD
jgi:transcription antitermination protein NusB